tara:strand:+ start:3738 stop:4460 length:723 start_codon:yes stop_codon:yes gene_type:complete
MVEQMSQTKLLQQEYDNHGTAWTRNQFFDDNGYLIIKNLCDPKDLFHPVPELRGQLNYRSKDLDDFEHIKVEGQVEGSIARYWHPQYREIHTQIRLILEQAIGRKLYNTYYYDRFYFPGQELTIHADRPACEISVSVHASSNLLDNWPIWIKTPDVFTDSSKRKLISKGENRPVNLEPGDGMVYKGCERPHWRDPMPGLLETSLERANGNSSYSLYYHQIFFHYVLQDGIRAHYAWDMAR